MLFVCLLSFLCGCPQPPNVQITVPEEGQVFTASPIAVSGTVTDEKPGVSATLSLGGQSWPLSLGTGGAFSREVALQEGENLISCSRSVSHPDREGIYPGIRIPVPGLRYR